MCFLCRVSLGRLSEIFYFRSQKVFFSSRVSSEAF